MSSVRRVLQAWQARRGAECPRLAQVGPWKRRRSPAEWPRNLILAPYPTNVGIAEGTIDPVTGDITPDGAGFVVKDCSGGTCAYYQYLQGTSMAAPHVVGVVALIVGRWGHRDNQHGGLELTASQAENILERTATDHACPIPSVYDYPILPATYNSNCDGSTDDNGWYGEGIVNALTAVTTRH